MWGEPSSVAAALREAPPVILGSTLVAAEGAMAHLMQPALSIHRQRSSSIVEASELSNCSRHACKLHAARRPASASTAHQSRRTRLLPWAPASLPT